MQRFLYITVSAILLIISCERNENSFSTKQKTLETKNSIWKEAHHLEMLWNDFVRTGETEKLQLYADSLFRSGIESGRMERSVYPAAYLANIYIYTNASDSAKKYLDFISRNTNKTSSPYGLYCNSMAEYAVKFETDYSKALKYLREAYEYYERNGQKENQALILNNISILYLQKNDTTGYNYAKKAYELSESIGDPYSKCVSTIALSRMEYLAGDTDTALFHCKEALSYLDKHKKLILLPTEAYITAGDIHTTKGDFGKADSCYLQAFSNIKNIADESVHTKLYLSYGNFLYKTGNYKSAEKYYLLGTQTAEKSNSIDNLYLIYLGLSQTYEKLSDKDKALHYYKKYYNTSTIAFNQYKEKEFNQLFLDYEKVKYEKDLQQKELEISDSRKVIIIISAVLAIAVILSISLIYIYRKKDRMYTILVEQHQQSLQQMKLKEKMAQENIRNRDDSKSQNEQELFNRLENLMKSEKIFRETDLTLDRIASLLDSNRTYVSSVINKYAGMTFPNYLNKYRINEAISIISDPDADVVLKAVCYEIGYKSMSPFYRAFQKETGCTPSVYREKVLKLKKGKPDGDEAEQMTE